MKKILFFGILFLVLMSCAPTQNLYYWGASDINGVNSYDKNLYESYKRQTPKALCDLICTYDDMVCHPGGTTLLPPPGICAEYGYILTQEEMMTEFENNASAKQLKQIQMSPYGSDRQQGATKLFQLEMTNYPESVKFLRDFVERITGQSIDIPAVQAIEKEANHD